MDIIQTRLDAPVTACALISRPQLMGLLPDVARTRLTLVNAPAGYGKTSLLKQWHDVLSASGDVLTWISANESDRSASALLAYVCAALSRAGLTLDTAAAQAADADLIASTDAVVAAVIAGLAACERPVFVFLDDAHLLGAPAVLALYRLIDAAPVRTHFVIASRSLPDLHIARLRGRGDLLELGVTELAFNVEEATRYLQQNNPDATLDPSQVERLRERTEGWITGIKVASLGLRSGSTLEGVLRSFTGSHRSVADFFAEEVLAAQPDDIREFLLFTSVLDRLCPSLCDALTGNARSQRLLKAIADSGLFLMHLDEERVWSRYHHLYTEFLRRTLDEAMPGRADELHCRASAWYLKSGAFAEAIEHALRGNAAEQAASMLEECCHDLGQTGRFGLVGEFVSRLPAAILHRHPRTTLASAWLMTRNLRFKDARDLIDIARLRVQEMARSGELANAQRTSLEYLLLQREMVLAAAQDDAPAVERYCQQLLEQFPNERQPYLRAQIYAQLLYARREQFRLNDSEQLAATAQGILDRAEYSFCCVALQASIAPSLCFAGKTPAAERLLEQALSEAIRFGGRRSGLAALPAMPLAAIAYERNDLSRAQALIDSSLPYVTEFGFVDQILPGYLTQARLCAARGAFEDAFTALDRATNIAAERGLERMRLAVIAERVRLLIQTRRPEDAARCLAEAGIERSADSALPSVDSSTRAELRALSWARVALASGEIGEMLRVAKHWRSLCSGRGAIQCSVQWDILTALALSISGDLRAAQRSLREAIVHAAPARMLRSFIDEGPALHNLLAATFDDELEVLHPTDAFAAELLDIFDQGNRKALASSAPAQTPVRVGGAQEGLYGKMSAREREILSLVGSGMRNREIARRLGMTEGSVKWYMQQVYDKVGARRRLVAVERARQFGLIA